MEKPLKTPYQIEKEKRDVRIYNEYIELMSYPGSQTTAVEQKLMAKHKIHARSTIWTIVKRVEKRQKVEA